MWKIDGGRGGVGVRCGIVVTVSLVGLVSCRAATNSDVASGSPLIESASAERSTPVDSNDAPPGSADRVDPSPTTPTGSADSNISAEATSESSLAVVAQIAGPTPTQPESDAPTPTSSPTTNLESAANPSATSSPADPAPTPDYLAALVDTDDDGWSEVHAGSIPIERVAPVRAYFESNETPEANPWFIVGRSTRPIGKNCLDDFRPVSLADGSNGCLRQERHTLMRLLVGDRPTQIEGRLTTSQALAVANSIAVSDADPESTPTVDPDGLPRDVTDQGEFIRVPGTSRSVSVDLVDTDLVTIEYRHGDGSTIEITSAIDSEGAFDFLRLDRVGGWKLTPLSSVRGYTGRHQVLSDRTVVWFEGGALIQVRSTGAAGAAIVDRLTDELERS